MRIGLITAMLAATGLPAAAQPAPAATPPAAPASRDPIGDILNRNVPPPKDEDEPDTAGQARTAPEPEADAIPPAVIAPPTATQAGPQTGPQLPFAAAPRQERNTPVRVEDAGKTPDAPLNVRDIAYDARIRSSFASAESFLGPLDGGWTLSTPEQQLYALQLVDRRDRLEGVWRDLRRRGALNGSGLVDDMQRQGGDLTLRFTASPGAEASVVTLHQSGGGQWTGELAEAGRKRSVTLRRTSP